MAIQFTSAKKNADVQKPQERKERSREQRTKPERKKPKVMMSIRLDEDVLDALRSEGPGYQTRINDKLRELLRL